MKGWFANESWLPPLPPLALALLLLCLAPFRVLLTESTCENCQQALQWREALTHASLCEICRWFLAAPRPALPGPDETADPRERARREFRCRAAEAIRNPRALDGELVAALANGRETGGIGVGSRHSEPARIFWTYAAQLRALPGFSPDDYDRLLPAVVAMTGRPHDSLDDPRWFERVGTLALIRAADADWLRVEGDTGGVVLKPGEETIWIEHVSLLKPADLRLKEEVNASVSLEIGATVSAKATLERATVCRINHTRNPEAAYVRCRSGLLLCAAINCGIRMSAGREQV